ncbi:unnamed protein product [Callosobruchus maculatus]|uniref:THAP-type domain-containing protein n=1 Tax=Callosobruchus maculatus TaxID=64391 RepID=A0A653DG96_CALMS|nr:unnamed protein product [Callosobruchus maculatus]
MVESCTAVNCCNRRTKGVKMKFHRIPINPYLRNLWLHAIRRINFTPSRTAVICEKHFTPQDYEVNVHGNRVLKKSAVPSIFNLSQQRGLNRKHDCSEEADDENVLEAGPSHLKDNPASELASGNENMLQTGQPNSTGKITSEVARVAGNENMLEAGPSNLIDRLGSSESCESSGSCNLGVCRARREPVYFEDFKFHDLNNMQRRKKFWEISHEHVQKYRKVNKYNLCRISRLKKKLESLNRLVDELLKEKKITAAQSFVLKRPKSNYF